MFWQLGPIFTLYVAGVLLIVNLVAMIISAFGLAGEGAGWSAVFGPWPFFAGLGTILVLAFGLFAVRWYLQPQARVAADVTQ